MRILFLLSCLEPAGSETYCLTLARAWEGQHDIFWISDRLHFGQSYTSFPIHQKAFPGGVLNTARVLRYVRENKIDVIHSHSRRAHWVAAQVSALTKIPHVTTIHQPLPVHLFSRLWPCLGDHTIAIDEAVEDHLRKHFRRGIRRLSLIRNGIEMTPGLPAVAKALAGLPAEALAKAGEGLDNRILYLGRLSGGRWRTLDFFFNVLKRSAGSLPKTCFQVVGHFPEERREELQGRLKEVNRVIKPSFVETHDFVANLAPFLTSCKGVIAGGRSALESLAAKKPVIAMGEGGVVGLCNNETWSEAMRTNFGDHFGTAADQFYPAKLEFGLRQILDPGAMNTELGRWGHLEVEKHYSVKKVAPAIDAVYRALV